MSATRGVGLGGTRSAVQAIGPSISQKLDFTGTSAQSAAFAAGTSVIRLFATQDCFIKIGGNPTAVVDGVDSHFIPGGIIQYFLVRGTQKLAAISNGTDGTLRIIEAESA